MMTTPNPVAPQAAPTEINPTDFMLAPGEKNVYGDKFFVSLLVPYLKAQMMCSSTRFVFKVPNTLLGIIPIGSSENTMPISSIVSVSVNSVFKVGRALLALIFVILGISSMKDSPIAAVLLVVIGVLFALTAMPVRLIVMNPAGGALGLEVSLLDKKKLEAFRQELQNRVFADAESLRHNEAQDLRAQSLAMQQMQLQIMQQQQLHQQSQQ